MKKLQGLLILLTGIALGGVGMMYYDKKVFNQMRERDQEYYDGLVKFYREELYKYGWSDTEPNRPTYVEDPDTDEEQTVEEMIQEAADKIGMTAEEWRDKYSGNVNNQIDYSAMAQKKPLSQILKEKGLNPLPDEKSLTRVHEFPEEDEPEVEEDEFNDEQPIKDIPKTRGIELITEEEFSDESDNEDYDRISLTYYNTDGVLVDERDEPVPSPENILGQEALASFGKNSKDPDVVYVRNDLTSTLFEVARVYQSFAEVVLGITEPIVQPKHEPIQKTKVRKVKKAVSDGEI